MTAREGQTSSTFRERASTAWKRLRGGSLSPGRAAASVAVGLFVGSLPVYGVQFGIVLAVCIPLRLDVVVAYVAAHVSNPFTLPAFLAAELEIGSLVLTGHGSSLGLAALKHEGLSRVSGEIAIGSVIVGLSLAFLGAAATWLSVHGVADVARRDFAQARKRTLARYAGAPRHARTYVALKLRVDPVLSEIVRLTGHFGRVVDAGCGFGQIGLCLFELGRATSLVGIDGDDQRISVARAAARDTATVHTSSLVDATFPDADTVLLIDVLHYLDLAAQDTVLERAVSALSPGGRLLVREVDASDSFRSRNTERMERRAAQKKGHDETRLAFRSAENLVETLERLGLSCTVLDRDDLTVVHNVLIVGTKPGLG